MILGRFTVCQLFKIKQPKWSTREVLLAAHRIGTHNEIVFTDAPTMPEHYYISGRDVHTCELRPKANGKLDCYVIPLRFLEVLERGEPEIPRSQKQLKLEVL